MLSGLLNAKLVVGVGKFAEGRAKSVIKVSNIKKYYCGFATTKL